MYKLYIYNYSYIHIYTYTDIYLLIRTYSNVYIHTEDESDQVRSGIALVSAQSIEVPGGSDTDDDLDGAMRGQGGEGHQTEVQQQGQGNQFWP